MSTIAMETRKPSHEEALRIAARRKAARRRRTSRIRKWVGVLAVSAFIGPFAVIYSNVASGKDPALAAKSNVTARVSGTTTNGASTAASGSTGAATRSTGSTSGSTGSSGSTSSATQSPAPVTTQQS